MIKDKYTNIFSPFKVFIVKTLVYIKFVLKLYSQKPIIILVWHQVNPKFIPGLNNVTDWTSSQDFEKSIQFLIRKKFIFISLQEAHNILAKSIKRKHRYVVITFDDGYSTMKETLPILEKYNIPATLFINTAYWDGKTFKWTDMENFIDSNFDPSLVSETVVDSIKNLKESCGPEEYDYYRRIAEKSSQEFSKLFQLYMTKEDLFAIDNPLFTIGLHGHEHEHHTKMTPEWGKQNILENFQLLKDHPNFIPYISFPFGACTIEEAEYFEELGFKTIKCNGLLNYHNKTPLNRSEIDGKILSYRLMTKLSGESFSFMNAFNFKLINHSERKK